MSKSDPRRVLLVEDEKAIRDAVAAYLERDGFWVTPAAYGAIALNAFHNDAPFDLIILDLMLPKIPGE
ncbi:MAG: response regulator, partial [Actinomycetia bacterium]|nr:response regulator [Actinomycetes bacterium]